LVTIISKADGKKDSGRIHLEPYQSTTTQPPSYAGGFVQFNNQRGTPVDVGSGHLSVFSNGPLATPGLTSVNVGPGDSIGIFINNGKAFRFGRVFVTGIRNVGGTGTGTVRCKVYDVQSGALISTSSVPNLDLSAFNDLGGGGSIFNFPLPQNAVGVGAQGVYVVLELDAGGSGLMGLRINTNATPTVLQGQRATRIGGVFAVNTTESPVFHLWDLDQWVPNELQWQSMTPQGSLPASGTTGYRDTAYHRFKGITIPQGAIINTALLALQVGTHMNSSQQTLPWKFGIKAVDDKSFSLPSPSISYTSYDSIHSKLEFRSAGVPFLKKTATPTQDLSVTSSITPTTTAPSQYDPDEAKVIDVKTIVQALVNKFDYDNDSMFFQIAGKIGVVANAYFNQMFIYTKNDSSSRRHSAMTGDVNHQSPKTTETSYGSSKLLPRLTVDFSLPVNPPVLRSCRLVDAILIAKGENQGRCGDEIYW